MKNYRFYKEEDGRWFIDLPEWEGDKDALEMVVGADTLLDIISQEEESVNVTFSEKRFDGYAYILTKTKEEKEEFGGAWYNVDAPFLTPFEIWLCSVTIFVFGYYPEKLYLR